MDMKFLLEWVFASLASLISVLLAAATRELQMVRKSVEQLNVNVAVVIERVDVAVALR